MKEEFKEIPEREETVEMLSEIEEELNHIRREEKFDSHFDRQIEFLSDCMEENLEHTRHIENERMNFIQIYLVLVGGVLAFLSANALEQKSVVVLIILVAVTLLGIFVKGLLRRWNQVYLAHRASAMYCYKKIVEACAFEKDALTEFPMDMLPDVKRQIPSSLSKQIPCYPFTFSKSGKTETMLKWFTNGLIIVTAVVAIGYFVKFWML